MGSSGDVVVRGLAFHQGNPDLSPAELGAYMYRHIKDFILLLYVHAHAWLLRSSLHKIQLLNSNWHPVEEECVVYMFA